MKSVTAWESRCRKPYPLCLLWQRHRLPGMPKSAPAASIILAEPGARGFPGQDPARCWAEPRRDPVSDSSTEAAETQRCWPKPARAEGHGAVTRTHHGHRPSLGPHSPTPNSPGAAALHQQTGGPCSRACPSEEGTGTLVAHQPAPSSRVTVTS